MANKIKFGLKNLHIFPITGEAGGKPSYGAAKKVPGLVALTANAEGDEVEFNADDLIYYYDEVNNGYKGDLELALFPDDILVEIFGMKKTESGVIIESADQRKKYFGMTFEINGDESATRYVFYKCALGRPDVSSKTKTKGVDPQTDKGSLVVMPRLDNGLIKAQCPANANEYATWHTQIFEPASEA